jgi:hypothetical protein
MLYSLCSTIDGKESDQSSLDFEKSHCSGNICTNPNPRTPSRFFLLATTTLGGRVDPWPTESSSTVPIAAGANKLVVAVVALACSLLVGSCQ